METCDAISALARSRRPKEIPMVITTAHLSPILAIAAGIAILLVPRLLNYIVAIYLILVGILGLGIVHI
jgi:hypothetical protein